MAQGSADEDGVISEGAARAWLGTGSLSERFASHRMHRPFIVDHRFDTDADRMNMQIGIKAALYDGEGGGWDARVTSVRVGEVWNSGKGVPEES